VVPLVGTSQFKLAFVFLVLAAINYAISVVRFPALADKGGFVFCLAGETSL